MLICIEQMCELKGRTCAGFSSEKTLPLHLKARCVVYKLPNPAKVIRGWFCICGGNILSITKVKPVVSNLINATIIRKRNEEVLEANTLADSSAIDCEESV